LKNVSLQTIADWCGGILEGENLTVTDVCRNTQALTKGCLFTPLIGERADGHRYIGDALRLGAAATLCSHPELSFPCPVIRVADTLKAAQAIAAGYRASRNVKMIGVTGSVGKTTTSRMISNVLKGKYNLLKTEDDMNGQIGLTYAMFGLDDSHDAAVMEMGMSQYGELRRLTHIAKPDFAVINSIGTAHIEFFGTREHILEAKLEILEGLNPDGVAIFCGDEPLLLNSIPNVRQKVVTYGIDNQSADVVGTILTSDAVSQTIGVSGLGRCFTFTLPSGGKHNAENALAACTVGILLDVSDTMICAGLGEYEGAKGRQRVLVRGGYTIIDDCYNASPDSVKAALSVLSSIAADKHIAVLGGMRELGAYAQTGHIACGAAAAVYATDLLCFGEGSEQYKIGALQAGMAQDRVHVFETREALAAYLKKISCPGDAILFKGSRYMKIEEVMDFFLKEV